jgi:hypothetical protein
MYLFDYYALSVGTTGISPLTTSSAFSSSFCLPLLTVSAGSCEVVATIDVAGRRKESHLKPNVNKMQAIAIPTAAL